MYGGGQALCVDRHCCVGSRPTQQCTGWGYETLVREVSDSLHLRRFCLLPLTARVPDESTIRKLARRLGPEMVTSSLGW